MSESSIPGIQPLPRLDCHDLRLGDWGPYTKRYIGISHIPNVAAGMRFDLSVFPGLFRRSVHVPNVSWESAYHPWEAAADLSFYSHRHEVIWKDQLYCDVSFSRLAENATLIRAACVNEGDQPQNMVLHYAASINPPPRNPHSVAPIHPVRVELPKDANWIAALSYDELDFKMDDPRAHLSPDGQRRGEVREHGLVEGVGLGCGFGEGAGDRAVYRFSIPHGISDAVLGIRFRLEKGKSLNIRLGGIAGAEVCLTGTGQVDVAEVSIGALKAGPADLSLQSGGGAELLTDGFFIADSQGPEVRFVPVIWNYAPQMIAGPRDNTLILKYDHIDCHYGLAWGHGAVVREFYGDDLDCLLRRYAHNHVSPKFHGEGAGHFTNIFMYPLFVAARSQQIVYGLICSGSQTEVAAQLLQFEGSDPSLERQYDQARKRAVALGPNPSGRSYQFSQDRMAATTLCNVVYPTRTAGTWIRHNTPGRWWDCLYTWDSGFVGLGLLQLDIQRAIDCLNAYLTPPGRKDAAFIHHGSPVPVQFYLYQELWNRTQSREMLAHFFPSLRRYHRFLAGRADGSTTARKKSNLLQTWDYFYNSGGWDDYPPQFYVHQKGIAASATPAVNTSHAIRTAKILKAVAGILGEPLQEFDDDIAVLSDALQRHSWDEEAGYFSYVVHDESGRPTGALRHASGVNFNMGMDGASPLVAGACTDSQQQRLIESLMSEKHMWCKYGLSTVDQSAPYFSSEGYWNGAVWMPHQWFFWKAMLDMGMADHAYRIAQTALDLWRQEVDESYNCYEHFMVQTGKGAGWHQFSGLSTPVLMWYAAYHRPGTLTLGMDGYVHACDWAAGHRGLTAKLSLNGRAGRQATIIACLSDSARYQVTWNGQHVDAHQRHPGALEVTLPADGCGSLSILAG